MTAPEFFKLGGYPLDGLIRRIRRTADLSQRQLAKAASVAPSAVAAYESARKVPSLAALQRMLHAANYQLVVIDSAGHLVIPLEVWDGVTDLAGRRFPPHLDTILDPVYGEWWADIYGLYRPPETFRRSRAYRDYERRLSRWEVRVAQLRRAPMPRPPLKWQPQFNGNGQPIGGRNVVNVYDETSLAREVARPPISRPDDPRPTA